MSIQSTVNQGLSLVGLLVSQTPMATQSKENALLQERKKRADRTYQELHETIGSTESHYSQDGMTEGDIRMERARNAAYVAAARERSELDPGDPEKLGDWYLAEERSDIFEEEKEAHEAEFARKKKKREEAEASAAEAQAEEQRRQAITREITRPFDPTVDKFKW